MVSLTTILRTSAEETALRTKPATKTRKIREIKVLFMGRQFMDREFMGRESGRVARGHFSFRTRIFLLLFATCGRDFLLGLAGAGIAGARAGPAGKSGASGDEARAALVSE